MVLYIKNMVCSRCIMIVQQQLDALRIEPAGVVLGEVRLHRPLPDETFLALKNRLAQVGFELLDDRKASLVAQIKSAIIQYVHWDEEALMNRKLSVLLSEKLGVEYAYLSALFSDVEGITLEKYVILQRIERVKELLTYNELSVNEIADTLGYSSVQHLSQQFKKVTGLTPSQFRQSKVLDRKPLDEIGI